MKKLEEVMVKLGVGKVKHGETASKKLRELIDKLHDCHVTANQSQISADKLKKKEVKVIPKTPTENPRVRVCPLGMGEVLIFRYCAVHCPQKHPELWEKCPVRSDDEVKGEI